MSGGFFSPDTATDPQWLFRGGPRLPQAAAPGFDLAEFLEILSERWDGRCPEALAPLERAADFLSTDPVPRPSPPLPPPAPAAASDSAHREKDEGRSQRDL